MVERAEGQDTHPKRPRPNVDVWTPPPLRGDAGYSPEVVEAPVRREEVAGEKALKKGKKRKARVKVQLEAPLKDVFKHTALDPDASVRHELMRKARKIRKGKKKKKKGSRSRSKESSGEETGESSDSSSL